MMNAERKKAAFEVNKFSKLATEHVNKNELDQAIHYFHSAYNSSEIMNVHSTIQSCAFNLGAACVANGDGQNGILYLQKALPPEGLGDPTSYGDLYYNLVLAYELINDRGQMKTFLEKAYNAYRKVSIEMEIDILQRMIKLEQQETKFGLLMRLAKAHHINEDYLNYASTLLDCLQFCNTGDSDKIQAKCQDAIEELKDTVDGVTIAKLCNKLGLFFITESKLEDAKDCFEFALENLSGNTQSNSVKAVLLMNLGTTCSLLKEYVLAAEYQEAAAKLCGLQDFQHQGHCYLNEGYAYTQLGRLEDAKRVFLHARWAAKRCGDKVTEWQAYENLGAVETNQKQFLNARDSFDAALTILHELGEDQKSSRNCYQILIKLQQVIQKMPPGMISKEQKTLREINGRNPCLEVEDICVKQDTSSVRQPDESSSDESVTAPGSTDNESNDKSRSAQPLTRTLRGSKKKTFLKKRISSTLRFDPQGKQLHTTRLKSTFLSPLMETDNKNNSLIQRYQKKIESDSDDDSAEEMSDISDEHTTRVDDSTEHTESQQDTESKNIGDEHTTRVDNSAENKQHTESQQDTESKKIVIHETPPESDSEWRDSEWDDFDETRTPSPLDCESLVSNIPEPEENTAKTSTNHETFLKTLTTADSEQQGPEADMTRTEDATAVPSGPSGPEEIGQYPTQNRDVTEGSDLSDSESVVGRAQREQRMLKYHQEHVQQHSPQSDSNKEKSSKACSIM